MWWQKEKMKPKVLVLFVRYGTYQYTDAFQRLHNWLKRLHIHPEKVILIDNQLSSGQSTVEAEAGDNRFYEFSGWNAILKKYPDLVKSVDVVLFVTSAFEESFSGYLNQFSPEIMKLVAERGVCVGHLDAYPEAIQIFGENSQSWMRTSFFALPARLVIEMGTLTAERADDFFSEDFGSPFKESAALSENYKKYILDWLTGPGLGHGPWHSRFDLTAQSFPRFRQKALAIFNEHFLSIEARKRGCPTLDPCWVNFVLRSQSLSQIPIHTSDHEQIEIRDRVYFGDLKPTFLHRLRRKWRNLIS
jgi:hypothetical protein